MKTFLGFVKLHKITTGVVSIVLFGGVATGTYFLIDANQSKTPAKIEETPIVEVAEKIEEAPKKEEVVPEPEIVEEKAPEPVPVKTNKPMVKVQPVQEPRLTKEECRIENGKWNAKYIGSHDAYMALTVEEREPYTKDAKSFVQGLNNYSAKIRLDWKAWRVASGC